MEIDANYTNVLQSALKLIEKTQSEKKDEDTSIGMYYQQLELLSRLLKSTNKENVAVS